MNVLDSYGIFGVLVPGLVLLVGSALSFPVLRQLCVGILAGKEKFPGTSIGALLIFAYLTGVLLAGVGGLVIDGWILSGKYPSDVHGDCQQEQRNASPCVAMNLFYRSRGQDMPPQTQLEKEWRGNVRQMVTAVTGHSTRLALFNREIAMHRGLTVAFSVAAAIWFLNLLRYVMLSRGTAGRQETIVRSVGMAICIGFAALSFHNLEFFRERYAEELFSYFAYMNLPSK